MTQSCPDCGAALTDGQSCESYFHQMLFRENEEPANDRPHDLMLLCCHLQHPAMYSMYSPEGLQYGRKLLEKLIDNGQSPQEVRQQTKEQVASNNRQWKIKGSAGSYSVYSVPIEWQMTAADVINGGLSNYCHNVEKWAAAIHRQLKTVKTH